MRFCPRCSCMMEASDPDTTIFASPAQIEKVLCLPTADEQSAAFAELRSHNLCRWEEYTTFECRECNISHTIKTADNNHPYGYDE